jgi:hypothetical protein
VIGASGVKRAIKNIAKRGLSQIFETGQRLGVDVLPRHFYSEISDMRELRRTQQWKLPRRMTSVAGSAIDTQIAFAQEVCRPDVCADAERLQVYAEACARNGEPGYGPAEAVFLYAFMRSKRPKRVVQVGCGVSTALMLAAAKATGQPLSICCIDPYPTQFLQQAAAEGLIELVARPAQEAVAERAASLTEGDMLFVDSTHTVKPGSEVNTIILDVLPELARGLWVHFHDITFPYDYPPTILQGELFVHTESTLLHAFLSCNQRYEIACSLSMLHFAASQQLQALIPSYTPAGIDHGLSTTPGHFPSATYLRVAN